MNRPNSIVQFERFYLGALLLSVIATALSWNQITEKLAANPEAAALGPGFVAASAAVGLLIGLVLWYFVARKASVVAKWIVVVFCALAVLGFVYVAATGQTPGGIGGILGIARLVLSVIAVVFLFRPDAKAWFGEPITE